MSKLFLLNSIQQNYTADETVFKVAGNAMVHWGEGCGGWRIYDQHFMKDGHSNPVRVAAEDVNDCCSIYDKKLIFYLKSNR